MCYTVNRESPYRLKRFHKKGRKTAEFVALFVFVQTISSSQSAAMEQINAGIDQVAQIVQHNSATAEESAASSEEMSAQAVSLEELINEFRHRNSEAAKQQDNH